MTETSTIREAWRFTGEVHYGMFYYYREAFNVITLKYKYVWWGYTKRGESLSKLDD